MPYPIRYDEVRPGSVLLLGPGPRRAHVLASDPDPDNPDVHRIIYHWETVPYAGALDLDVPRLVLYGHPGQIVALATDSGEPPRTPVRLRLSAFAFLFYTAGGVFLLWQLLDGTAVFAPLNVLGVILAVSLALTALYQFVRTLKTRKKVTT